MGMLMNIDYRLSKTGRRGIWPIGSAARQRQGRKGSS
jgi:hypothetical protein